MRLDSFEEAFRDGIGTTGEVSCHCGNTFDGGSYISFEGTTYLIDCECWKPRAQKIADWLSGHDTEIAAYLTLERKRKQEEAERSPVVMGSGNGS